MIMLDKGMSHVLGGMEWDGERFHQAIQDSAQFKIYALFVSGIFPLMLLDYS